MREPSTALWRRPGPDHQLLHPRIERAPISSCRCDRGAMSTGRRYVALDQGPMDVSPMDVVSEMALHLAPKRPELALWQHRIRREDGMSDTFIDKTRSVNRITRFLPVGAGAGLLAAGPPTQQARGPQPGIK